MMIKEVVRLTLKINRYKKNNYNNLNFQSYLKLFLYNKIIRFKDKINI